MIMTKRKEQTIEEKIKIYTCPYDTQCLEKDTGICALKDKCTSEIQQIILLVRADECKAERERIREGIEKFKKLNKTDSELLKINKYEFQDYMNNRYYNNALDDIRKLLRPESDTENNDKTKRTDD